MFLTQIKSFPKTQFWRYIVGFSIMAWCYVLGQLPLFVGWVLKKGEEATENGLLGQIIQGFQNLQNTPQRDFMTILPNNSTLVLALLMFVFTLFGIILALKWLHGLKLKHITTSRKKVDWNRILFSFSLLAIFSVVSTLASYWATPEDYIWNFQWKPFLTLLVIVIVLLPIQTSVEEWIFRGYLMQGFTAVFKNRFIPLIITSVTFGLMHLANPEMEELGYYAMLFYIGTGLFLGILTLMDDGLELALGFHAANNMITALLVTADYSVLQTDAILKQTGEPEIGFEIILPVIILYPIFLFIFAKKYKWSNWKSRLFGSV